MKMQGRVWKDGRLWTVEVDAVDVTTQGVSRANALAAIKEAIEMHVDDGTLAVTVHDHGGEHFAIEGADAGALMALALKRQRLRSGMSLADVQAKIGASSRNAYARYEQGRSTPSVAKFEEAMRAVSGGRVGLVLRAG